MLLCWSMEHIKSLLWCAMSVRNSMFIVMFIFEDVLMRYVVMGVLCSLCLTMLAMDTDLEDQSNLDDDEDIFRLEYLIRASEKRGCRAVERSHALSKQVETNGCRNICMHVTNFAFASLGWLFSCIVLRRVDDLGALLQNATCTCP